MARICVASQNPVKLRAAEAAFKLMFAVETHHSQRHIRAIGRGGSTDDARGDLDWRAQPSHERA